MPLSRQRQTPAVRVAGMLIALLFMLTTSGCWTFSLQPLFDGGSDPDLIFDESLVGSWGHLDQGCQLTLTVQASVRAYDMTLAPGAGCKSDDKNDDKPKHYLAYLVKLDNHRYLDIQAKQSDVCDLCLPAHTFAQLSLESNTFSVTPLDGDWLFEAVKQKKVNIANVSGWTLDMTLNAEPAELKALLRKYADDPNAFKASQRLVFTRK